MWHRFLSAPSMQTIYKYASSCSLLFEPEHQASTKDCCRVLLPVPGVTWLSRCDAEAKEYTLKVVRDASSSAQNKNADANSDTNLDLTCQQKLIQHMLQIVLESHPSTSNEFPKAANKPARNLQEKLTPVPLALGLRELVLSRAPIPMAAICCDRHFPLGISINKSFQTRLFHKTRSRFIGFVIFGDFCIPSPPINSHEIISPHNPLIWSV